MIMWRLIFDISMINNALERKNKEHGWKIISEDITERWVKLKKAPEIFVVKYIVYLEKV